ncbi:isoprenoid synthase domain-containing protein [Dactylonectria estremocensis]|uniref:Isoprenoid synthase domain-containing protein n=1 Tax=Dactylonectria estremocensis TaxID=1079267 RepID=A0A9P9FCJ5_9HYPO|nr:isoprenoid synthase domain-containing protein [Dactylonectria estremocensis]
MVAVPEESIAAVRETLSRFVSGVTGGREIDSDALTVTPIDKLRAAVVSELESSSLSGHLDLINSKGQFTMACHVAADFTSSHPLEYQVVVAQLTIFFFHAEDMLEHQPDVLRRLQLNVATGKPCGDPVLDWYARELTPQLWEHFDPLVANMVVVACYDFINGVGIELLTQEAQLHRQAPNFPDWVRFKTGLSPMYALLALARPSDPELATGGFDKYIQTIPDVIVFTNIVNDVISFYKEFLAGEKANYMSLRAQKDGVDVVTAMHTLADEGICIRDRVLAALEDEPEYRANFDTYAKGITHFHTSSPRYRLVELFGHN